MWLISITYQNICLALFLLSWFVNGMYAFLCWSQGPWLSTWPGSDSCCGPANVHLNWLINERIVNRYSVFERNCMKLQELSAMALDGSHRHKLFYPPIFYDRQLFASKVSACCWTSKIRRILIEKKIKMQKKAKGGWQRCNLRRKEQIAQLLCCKCILAH